jgi:hypothetical protein
MEERVNMQTKTAETNGTEIKGQVGETAGQVWHALTTDGPMTLTQLKKKLNGQGDLLGYAIGWLAREDKIDMVMQKKTLRVQLK